MPLLVLQRHAGNAAVSRLLQRVPITDMTGMVAQIEFTVGTEIGADLAVLAKKVAATGVTVDELRKLRTQALKGETIGDDERMFLAGLLEPANAQLVAQSPATAGTKYRFDRSSITAHMNEIKDLERPDMPADVLREYGAAIGAALEGDLAEAAQHRDAAEALALKQIVKLATRAWAKQATALTKFVTARSLNPMSVMAAMVNGGSDSTPGDMVMAGNVYAIAAAAGHPLANDLARGIIKVDQLANPKTGDFEASYATTGMGLDKGDTVYVPAGLQIDDLADRRSVIHELQHAQEDKAASSGKITIAPIDESEVKAYRAGARYELDQIDAMKTTKERDKAVNQSGAGLNPIFMLALAIEAHRDKRFEMIVVDINNAAPASVKLPMADLVKLLATSDVDLEKELRERIRIRYRLLDAQGNLDPAKNAGRLDAQSGESVLDWFDRR